MSFYPKSSGSPFEINRKKIVISKLHRVRCHLCRPPQYPASLPPQIIAIRFRSRNPPLDQIDSISSIHGAFSHSDERAAGTRICVFALLHRLLSSDLIKEHVRHAWIAEGFVKGSRKSPPASSRSFSLPFVESVPNHYAWKLYEIR